MKLIHGDCLIESEQIESGSVDLILTDLPYGTMNGAGLDGWGRNKTNWDFAIDPQNVYEIANRILRKNGKMVLFSQEPYTSRLITQAIANVPFSYRMMWEKDHFANSLIAKKAPVSYFEDILVFSKNHEYEALHPLREYALKIKAFTNYSRNKFYKKLGCGGAQHFLESNKESSQFSLCTSEIYHKLIDVFGIDKMKGFKPYSELKAIDNKFKQQYASTFNLWEGNKYKSNILKYKKDYDGYHPTQKPVLLLEDLIKTFSNEGDLVVDLTMGSGSTGVACVNTGRDFIGIELDEGYFKIAQTRIHDAQSQGELF
jgi:site-specific DNA-methyltransferase (adenine-specific)